MKFFTLKLLCLYKRSLALIAILFSFHSSFSQVLGWTQVPSPDTSLTRNMVRGISGTSSSDIWAVGSFEETHNFNPYNVEKDLIMHWDGSGWKIFPPMNLSTTLDDLWGVEAISTNNVWAVGNYNDGPVRAEILHYDGTSWQNHPVPVITGGSYLYSIDATSANDIWAAGGKFSSPTRLGYIMHYNGSSWTEIPVPPVGTFRNAFYAIDGINTNDVWAAGHWGDHYGDFHALVMHWDGSSWVNSPVPASVSTELGEVLDIKMISANDVWAVGAYLTGGMFKIHWDGSNWSEITPANGGGGAFAALAPNDVYSVGGEISHWNGNSWTVIDSLKQLSYPALGSTVVFPNGEIWAAGRTVDADNNFHSLVYRSVNNQPVFPNGSSQNWITNTNSNGNSIDSLLKTQDADESQVLVYSVIASPAHGTLNGFPDTAISHNGFAVPSGLTYTPAPGYAGNDQFIIKVSAGQVSSQTTIQVNVLGALPVTLTDFSVTKQHGAAIIKWNTVTEVNTSKFEVERSVDGATFKAIATVTAKGNSTGMTQYNKTDNLPSKGWNYYRLKQVDKDGRVAFSDVKNIYFETNELQQLVIYPNPVSGRTINLSLNAPGNFILNLYNQQGQKVYSQKLANASSLHQISLPQYITGGVYSLVIEGGETRMKQNIIIL